MLPAEPEELRPPAGVFVIAKCRDQLAGCGGVKLHGRAPAELKRMWVSPAARGLGIGRHLLGQLVQHARDAGARVIRLETNRALREAIELYRKSGYVEVAPFNQEPTHITGWRSDLPQKKVAIPGERPLLVIIAESTARKYWPTRDPLGRRVRFRRDPSKP